MVAFSKYFIETITAPGRACDVIHAGTCWDSTVWNFTQTINGCVKFVLPLALLPIIMKIKRLNRAVFMQSASIFYNYFMGAWLASGLGLSFICVLRKIFGKFHYFTVLALPSSIGAAICAPILRENVVHTYAHGMSALAIEVSIRRGDFYIFKWIRNSRAIITIAFMCANALLLHGLRINSTAGFYWLIQPEKRKQVPTEIVESSPIIDKLIINPRNKISFCPHENSCDSYVIEGVKSFAKFGIGLEVARNLISNYYTLVSHPLTGLRNMISRMKWNLVAFLVSYVTIYRITNCITTRNSGDQTDVADSRRHLCASVLSGLSFYLYPNASVFCHVVVTTIELYWKLNKHLLKKHMRWLPLDVISMNKIFFPLLFGYLTHVRAFTPWLAPSILKKLMHLSTNYKDAEIYTNYHRALFGLKPQFIL